MNRGLVKAGTVGVVVVGVPLALIAGVGAVGVAGVLAVAGLIALALAGGRQGDDDHSSMRAGNSASANIASVKGNRNLLVVPKAQSGSVNIRGDGNAVDTSVRQEVRVTQVIYQDQPEPEMIATYTRSGRGGLAMTHVGWYPRARWKQMYDADMSALKKRGYDVLSKPRLSNARPPAVGMHANEYFQGTP